MRQTELYLTDEDRELIESYGAKGLHHAREVNRAHILSALDRGIPEAQIMAGVGGGGSASGGGRRGYLGNMHCAMSRAPASLGSLLQTSRQRLPLWSARSRRKVPSAGRSSC